MHFFTIFIASSLIFISSLAEENDPGIQQELELRAQTYVKNKETEKALTVIYQILARYPNSLNARFSLGNAFCQKKQYEQALEQFDYIITQIPDLMGAIYNKAYILKSMGRMYEAIPLYETVIKNDPSNENAHYGLSQAYLAVGNFEKGWYELQFRFDKVGNYLQEPIDTKTLAGKHLLLRGEFGFGDMIQFVRFAKEFKKHGAIVSVQIFKELVPLFSQCPFIDQVIPAGSEVPTFDITMPLMSAPVALQTKGAIPADIPYLEADPKLVTYWKEKLAHDTNFKIGICWHAKPSCFLEDNPLTQRSIPLKLFESLASRAGVSLYSLQKKHGVEELDNLPEGMTVHDFGQDFDTTHGCFMDTAAVMKNLDLIISADTSTVHLAGALGIQTWVLLPSVSEWRWLQNRNDSPWYPNNMRLFRQQKQGDWQSVMQEVAYELKKIITTQQSNKKPAMVANLLKQAQQLIKENNNDRALNYLQQALDSDPNNMQAHMLLANVLSKKTDYEKAIEHYDVVLMHNPSHITALHNKAFSLKALGKWHEAIDCYEKALTLDPNHSGSHLGISEAYLAIGNLLPGWKENIWRLQQEQVWQEHLNSITSFSGKKVVILSECAFGDAFHFIRYAKLLKEAGASVIIQTFKELKSLFSRCDYIDEIIEIGNPLPHANIRIPLMSLPLVFKTTLDTIPTPIPYLYTDPALVEDWKKKLAHDTNFKIGICWQTNPTRRPELNPLTKRSIPLSVFAPLTKIPGISVYSLQKGYGTEQLQELPIDIIIHDLGNELDEEHGCFMDTSAVMKNLDLIISADTSIVHLAGALNIKIWTLLPYIGEFRWLQERTDSPWYPTMRLFRQQKHGDWQSVMQEVANELKKIITTQQSHKKSEMVARFLQQAQQLIKENNDDSALNYLQQALDSDPDNMQAHLVLANVLSKKTDYEKAIEHYDIVLMHNPSHITALHNKAFSLKALGKMHEAIENYEQILATDPEHHNALYGIAPAYLCTGNLEKGFEMYTWRLLKAKLWKEKLDIINTFAGKKIIILAEFGLGDALQFIRYAKIFKQLGATVIVETFTPLVPLFSRCPFIDQVIPQGNERPACDITIPTMSLPYLFKTTLDTIPTDIPYLQADPELVTYWKEKLSSDTNFKIGICWQGTYHNQCEKNRLSKRSIPLELFAPLSTIAGVSLYSLQKMEGTDQLNTHGFTLHDFGPKFDIAHGRFMDTAAVMKNFDLIISIDTAPAHLAGALGVPVWLLLPPVADWRWLQDRTDTPWYPTMQLFRKKEDEDWQEVMQKIAKKLEKIIQRKNEKGI